MSGQNGMAPNGSAYQAAAMGPYNPSAPATLPPWSYQPPAAGVGQPKPGLDLKGPLAQFAMNMAIQNLAPKAPMQIAPSPMPPMAMQPGGAVRSPYGMGSVPYQARALGRLGNA